MNICACGCKKEVKGKWAQGHHSRVNNISKRPDVKEKRRKAMTQLHEENKIPCWNRGLSKETDIRVANYGLAGSKSWDEEKRKKYSNLMKEQRKTGKIQVLSGSSHSQWKGGTSTITQRCRGNLRFYNEWKLQILKRDNFTCVSCKNSKMKLAVHHDKERFASIIKKCMNGCSLERELSWDEQTEIVEKVINYHVKNNVSGITLCYDCHEKIHHLTK